MSTHESTVALPAEIFFLFQQKKFRKPLTKRGKSLIINKSLRNCVMVARQTLTLFVWVQILVPQPCRGKVRFAPTFFILTHKKSVFAAFSPAPAPSNFSTAEKAAPPFGLIRRLQGRLAGQDGLNRCSRHNKRKGYRRCLSS